MNTFNGLADPQQHRDRVKNEPSVTNRNELSYNHFSEMAAILNFLKTLKGVATTPVGFLIRTP